MTGRLELAVPQGAAGGVDGELVAYLGRLLHWDRRAVVRLRSAEGEPALGVFGSPPFGGVLAVKSMALTGDGVAEAIDVTVSAGQLQDAAVRYAEGGGEFVLPGTVTGPAWAGLLPPRAGWRREAVLDADAVRRAAAVTVAEFRSRTEALPPDQRTRAELDALAEELWSRPLAGSMTGPDADAAGRVTLRIVHAAHALGFLRGAAAARSAADLPAAELSTAGVPTAGSPVAEAAVGGPSADRGGEAGEVAVLTAGPWVRLRTGYGSVAARGASAAAGLTFSPAR